MPNLKELFFIGTVSAILFIGCSSSGQDSKTSQSYRAQIEAWHKKRVERLSKKDSWLSLAGLFWLKSGENTFGSGKKNGLVFPQGKAPEYLGKIILTPNKIQAVLAADAAVFNDGQRVRELELKSDAQGKPTILRYASLSWYVIKRGSNYLVRLKDAENPALKNFTGIETYPIDRRWRVKAQFIPYNTPQKIMIANVLGQLSAENSPGKLVFKINGQAFSLDPLAEEKDDTFFVIFSDETSGRETYGAGRFLEVERPDKERFTYIDFNKAYNPPCAFSDFATCPLPPKQNHLLVKISAGEKEYGHHNEKHRDP